MERREHFKRHADIIFIVAIVLLAAAFILFRQVSSAGSGGPVAVLYINGSEAERYDLETAEDVTISLMDKYGIPATLEIANSQIRFINVTCPDHLCEKAGFISTSGQMAVCMPNRAAVVVYSKDELGA